MRSSTLRNSLAATVAEPKTNSRLAALRQTISADWLKIGHADLVSALRSHPELLRDRSLLLGLAIEEYLAHRQDLQAVDLAHHCDRFREFGSSIERSIFRQLEAQRYLDAHPELLESLSIPDWPEIGRNFGNFAVLAQLGAGSVSRVYLCRELDVGDRQVVVKVTPVESFEASFLGRLNHPNIIPIYSTGITECGLYYLCMPYCGSSTLSDLLDVAFDSGCPRRNDAILAAAQRWTTNNTTSTSASRLVAPMQWQTYVGGVLRLAIQIADALDYAHRQGILHGDLKPSNVLLTPHGKPLLLDFNLSQDHASSSSLCGGTLPYMPPEHLRLVAQGGSSEFRPAANSVSDGRSSASRRCQNFVFEPRSDIYSFGALLYELLAGIGPTPLDRSIDNVSAAAEQLLQRLQNKPAPIRERNSLVSHRLESLVLRCLSFDPRQRPATMTEVARELRREMRSLASLRRIARVRPVAFAAIVGLPLALLGFASAHVTMQPPRYLTEYHAGVQLAARGEPAKAVEHLLSAVTANPAYIPAQFELARARLAAGEVDAAMNDFSQLARETGSADSMAYLGYCFNIKHLPIAAIPWYERAIEKGAASISVYNNLSASYLAAPTRLPYVEQLRLSYEYLQKGLELDANSPTLQLNVVRYAEAKARVDREFNPSSIWKIAKTLLKSRPEDVVVRSQIAGWYAYVVQYELAHQTVSEIEASARDVFAGLYESIHAPMQGTASEDHSFSLNSSDKNDPTSQQYYYLEPSPSDRSRS